MQKQLAAIVASLESAQTRLHRLADQLPDARWKSRPGPDQWSAAECIEHLNLTSRAYIPLLRHALEVGTKPATPPTRYRKDFLGGLFSALVGPLPRIAKRRLGRVKTTGEFVPQPKATRVETVAEFDRLQAELIAITRQADGFPLGEMKIVSPFGGKIRYNVYSALVILPRHQDRHLGQAEDAATVGKTAN
jgi:hypothetical protein